MLRLLILLCSILLVAHCSTTKKDKYEDIVNTAVKHIDYYHYDDLSAYGTEMELLMKTVLPIAELAAQSPKLGSAEYMALMEFKNRTVEERKTIRWYREFYQSSWDPEYDEVIIKNMTQLVWEYLDPEINKTEEFIANFKMSCDTIPSILENLRHRLVDECQTPVTPSDVESLTNIRAPLHRALLQLRMDWDVRYKSVSVVVTGDAKHIEELMEDSFEEFSTIYKQLKNKEVLDQDFDVFYRKFDTNREAIEAYFKELREKGGLEKLENIRERCPLRQALYRAYFNNPRFESFTDLQKINLKELSFAAGVCVNEMYNGDVGRMEEYAKKIVDEITRIASHTIKWVEDSMESSWPSAHNQVLREEIMHALKKYKTIASYDFRSFRRRLEETGPKNYTYEMIVVQSDRVSHEHYFEGVGDYCTFKKRVPMLDGHRVDTVIGRIPGKKSGTIVGSGYLSDDSMDRINELNLKSKNLIGTIKKEMRNIPKGQNVTMVADSLKTNIAEKFIKEKDFHCWSIVRQWSSSFMQPCPEIKSYVGGFKPSYYSDFTTISTTNHINNGSMFEKCEEFQFFLLA